MRLAGSLIMACADRHQVPAGGALAVDRDGFSEAVTQAIDTHPRITVVREEVQGLPPADWGLTIFATGSAHLRLTRRGDPGGDRRGFARLLRCHRADRPPRVHQHGYLLVPVALRQGRPGGNGKDYINCPLDKAQYDAFVDALIAGDTVGFKEWEGTPYFDGCLPIEVMAERGRETLRHGPMKPMGLTNAHNPTVKAYAVVQLRQDNALGTLYNMVGFQTKLKYGAQAEIFRMIPGLENAEFARLGGLHRNTYIHSPTLLDQSLRLKSRPTLRFAGQITGCEGYVESAAIGLLAGRFAAADAKGETPSLPPATTALGALLNHITGGHLVSDDEPGKRSFQPMNVNFGLFPELAPGSIVKPEGVKRFRGKDKTVMKRRLLARRALTDCAAWLGVPPLSSRQNQTRLSPSSL